MTLVTYFLHLAAITIYRHSLFAFVHVFFKISYSRKKKQVLNLIFRNV